MTVGIVMDFRSVLADLTQTISFSDESADIVTVHGEAEVAEIGATVGFTREPSGNILWERSPALSLVRFELRIVARESRGGTHLLVNTSVGGEQFISKFQFERRFPLTVEGRLRIGNMIQLQLTNVSDVPLFASNRLSEEFRIVPGECRFVLHEQTEKTYSLLVREEKGEGLLKEWELDDQIMHKRIDARIEGKQPLIAGASVQMHIELPLCSYAVQSSPDVLVFGRTAARNFAGGTLTLLIVPIRVGRLQSPKITVDGVVRPIHPLHLEVTAAGLFASGPCLRIK
jgi:hypothetical protein